MDDKKHNATPKSLEPVKPVLEPVFAAEQQVQNSVRRERGLKKRFLIACAALVVVLFLAWLVTTLVSNFGQNEPPADQRAQPAPGRGLPDDYALLSSKDAANKLEKDTGLSIATLQQKIITEETFTDFDQAYAAAQALYAVEDYPKSLEAYEAAAKLANEDVEYRFYLNYAGAADAAGDEGKGNQMIEKAKTTVQASDASDAVKAQVIKELDEKLFLRKAEG